MYSIFVAQDMPDTNRVGRDKAGCCRFKSGMAASGGRWENWLEAIIGSVWLIFKRDDLFPVGDEDIFVVAVDGYGGIGLGDLRRTARSRWLGAVGLSQPGETYKIRF